MATSPKDLTSAEMDQAVAKRRNFAIISHPDAGKTTLTEKLLLYGGAIQQAGAVKARGEQRRVTSDWIYLLESNAEQIETDASNAEHYWRRRMLFKCAC